MECLANVLPCTGRAVERYAKPLYDRALGLAGLHLHAALLQQHNTQQQAAQQQPQTQQQRAEALAVAAAAAALAGPQEAVAEADPSYIVLGLDVVSGLAQALHASVESLVAASPLVPLLMVACR